MNRNGPMSVLAVMVVVALALLGSGACDNLFGGGSGGDSPAQSPPQVTLSGTITAGGGGGAGGAGIQSAGVRAAGNGGQTGYLILAVDEDGNTTTGILVETGDLDDPDGVEYELSVTEGAAGGLMLFEFPSLRFIAVMQTAASEGETGSFTVGADTEANFVIDAAAKVLSTTDLQIADASATFSTHGDDISIDTSALLEIETFSLSVMDFFPRRNTWTAYADQPDDKDEPDRLFSLTYDPGDESENGRGPFDRMTVLTEYYNGDSGFWDGHDYSSSHISPPADPSVPGGVGGLDEGAAAAINLTISSQDFAIDADEGIVSFSFYDPTGDTYVGAMMPLNPRRGDTFVIPTEDEDVSVTFNGVIGHLNGEDNGVARRVPVVELQFGNFGWYYRIGYYGAGILSESRLNMAGVRDIVAEDIRMGSWSNDSIFALTEFVPGPGEGITFDTATPKVSDGNGAVRQKWVEWLFDNKEAIRAQTIHNVEE